MNLDAAAFAHHALLGRARYSYDASHNMRPACNVSPPDVVMSRVVDVRGEGLLYDEGDWQTLAIVRAPTPLSPLRSSCGAVLGSTPPECVDGLWSTAAQSGSTLINSVILTMSASELVPYDFRRRL